MELDETVGGRVELYPQRYGSLRGAEEASKIALVHNEALKANSLPQEDLELLREVYWYIREVVMD